jgi:amino acid adenylation domain-containing protein
MNPTLSLLTELHQQGVKLWVDGEQLRINAPKGVLTPALTDRLKAQKPALMALLREAEAGPRTPPIRPVERTGPLPLSFAQQRLWFLNRLGSEEAYNMPARIRLQGTLDPSALEQSLAEIVRRHESLRTTFHTIDGEARQVIGDERSAQTTLTLPVVDLSGLPLAEQEAEIERYAAREALHPFNLEADLLIRATLLRLGAPPSETPQAQGPRTQRPHHLLLLTMHHIASDGWSMEVLWRELATLYPAFVAGKPSPLPPLTIQYADFAHWQRQWLRGEILDQQIAYWKKQLAGAPPLLALPTDRPRPAVQSFQGAKVTFTIPDAVTQGLRRLSRQTNATLFMTLLAAFKVLLARYTDQDDIVVDTPIAGRTVTEIEPLIGFFVNTLVLRTDLSRAATFTDLLAQVRQVTEAAFDHQEAPFEGLVEALQPERSLAYNPISQVSFALQSGSQRPMQSMTLAGLQICPPVMEVKTVRADLEMFVFDGETGLSGECVYSTALFDAATIERMMGHYQTLLAAIAQEPAQPLAQLPLLSDDERRQLLVEWNATQADYPQDSAIHHLFEEQAARIPDATALIYASPAAESAGSGVLTYAELNARANQLAHYLRTLGVGPESLVGIGLNRSPAMIVAMLGVLKAGGAYVPLDANYPSERLRFMLEDAQPAVVLADAAFLEKVPADDASADASSLVLVNLAEDWPIIAQQPIHNPAPLAGADNLAYVIYTSGSTGQPKGAMITHRALVNHATAMMRIFGLTAADRVLQFAAFSFDVAAEEIFPTWLAGAAVVLPPTQRVMAVSELLGLVTQQGVSVLNLPASYWHEWVLQLEMNPVPAGVRLVIVGSEKVSGARLATWQAHVTNRAGGASGLRPTWINAYGLSETTITSTVYTPDLTQRPPILDVIPIGRPIDNTQIYILDATGQPAPIGVPGELYIGGDGVARGYLNRPELTAERFVDLRFTILDLRSESEHNENQKSKIVNRKSYKTGDRARYLADGNIEFLGRADTQVKIRGFRVEPGAIEALLAEHPQVAEAVVVEYTDPTGNNGLVAYLVWHDTAGEIATLRQFLAERVPDYMVPAAMMAVEAIPKLPNGKLDRRSLPAPTTPTQGASDFVAPSTETEAIIAAIWREALQRPAVGIHDNFFDLGGHSLLLLRVHHQLQTQLGQPIAVIDLFQFPTIRALSEHLADQQRANRELPMANGSPSPAARRPLSSAASAVHGPGEIAIVGMSCRFPGARNVDEFWRNLREGVESLLPIDDEEIVASGVDPDLVQHPHYVKRMGRLPDIDQFDAAFFGYTPREAAATDPQHRLFIECAWEALEQAGYAPASYAGRIGVFAGSGFNSYRALNLTGNDELTRTLGEYQIAVSNEADAMVTRVSYKMSLTGPSVAVHTACSTSLVAVHMASKSLLAGECEMALAGGATVHANQAQGYLYEEGMILSPDGHCRAFDAQAQGTAAGNGVGVVVLKRLSDALADGDLIYAVIKGSAINNDGARKVGYTAPSVEGQSQVIQAAQANAQVNADSISYIEAHGTGTPLGDPIEIAALTQAFRQQTAQKGFCALGAVKTNIGHLDTAAGVAGLIKTALALHHKQIPPSLHFTTPNPHIDFANSPFYVNARLAEWTLPADATSADATDVDASAASGVRRAGVSSFGIGGTNAHIILEEAPSRPVALQPDENEAARPLHLLLLSARTPAALEAATDQLADHLAAHPDLDLADVAYTLSLGRTAFAHRRVVLCADTADAVRVLRGRGSTASGPQRIFTSSAAQATKVAKGKASAVAMLFSGQGAQYVAMGRDLYAAEPIFRQEVDRCCDLLLPHLGFDLRTLLYPESDAADVASAAASLNQTAVTQPTLFVIEYALARLWEAWGVRAQAMIGHSIGEYVAATLAGVFSLEDALALVATRGRLMQSLPGGAMLAVSLTEVALGRWLTPDLSLAAINGPERCVVAGTFAAIDDLETRLTAQGIACRRLHTSHAFHSPMMEPILAEFTARVGQVTLNPPQRSYLSNVTGRPITAAEATDPAYWARHLRQAVRFSDGVANLLKEQSADAADAASASALSLLEIGPGRTLATLVSQHPARRAEDAAGVAPADVASAFTSLPHPQQAGEVNDASFLLSTLGQLWVQGVAVDWEGFYAGAVRRRVALPTYPFERQRYWVDPAPARAKSKSASTPTADGTRLAMADWFHIPSWQRKPLLAQTSSIPLQGSTLIFADEAGLGDQLAAHLRAQGQNVTVVEAGADAAYARQPVEEGQPARYTLAPAAPEGYRSLLQDLADQGEGSFPTQIVHLWSVTAEGDATGSFDPQDRGFYSLLFLAQALAQHADAASADAASDARHLLVVSNNMQEVAGEAWLDPIKATLLGPVTVIPQEFERITTQSVDLVLPAGDRQRAQLINQLAQELSAHSDDRFVAYRGQHRWVRDYDAIELPAAEENALPLRQRGVYLITGGLGGIGLALAADLARSVQARLILVGRSPFPAREEWDQWLTQRPLHPAPGDQERLDKIRQLQALEAAGAEVHVVTADVTDLAQMQQVVETAQARFGPIHGVIHAAGAPGDGMILRKTRDAAAQVLAPKVQGALVLDEALADVELDWMLLCSSLTAITGGFGQVDYCAANAFLDAFAGARNQRRSGLTVSVNWESWRETGMAVDAAQRQRSPQPVGALPAAPPAIRNSQFAQQIVDHPLFAECWLEAEGSVSGRSVRGRSVRYISRLSVETHWLLGEQRLLGQPTLPGTAYLEMARAAFADLTQRQTGATVTEGANGSHPAWTNGSAPHPVRNAAVELSEVFLLQPLVAEDDAPIEVHTTLEAAPLQTGTSSVAESWQFSIQSYTPARGWQEHARGEIALLPDATPGQHPVIDVADGAEIRPQKAESIIQAGPRWQSFVGGQVQPEAGVARFQLPAPFVDDLAIYHLHPALLDVAANFFAPILDDGYLPFAYERIRLYRPLTAHLTSRMRLSAAQRSGDETRRFDLVLMDDAGQTLVEIDGYTLRKMAPPAGGAAQPGRSADAATLRPQRSAFSLEHGLTTAEGVDVFRRVLAQSLPQVLVSTQDLMGEIELANRGPLLAEAETDDAQPEGTARSLGQRPALAQAYVAPRTELEARIARVWESFLGIEPVGVHDDFFAFGGDSLMAIQITSRLSAALKQKLSPTQFLNLPTVAALAELLEQPADASGGSSRTAPSPLVNLHKGDAQTPPIFLIHPVGGSIYHYRHLAQSLGAADGASSPSIYAIQSPGLDGETEPLTSVEGMAGYYLQLIRQVQPQSPYWLGGWSLGGVVAFEMAQQLRAQGEAAHLLMVDTFLPVKPETPISDAEYAAHFVRHMGDVLGQEFDLEVETLARMDTAARVQLIVDEGRRRGILPVELGVEQIHQRLGVYTANFCAMDSYTPQPYDAAVLFVASTDSIGRSGDATLGWSALLAGATQQGRLHAEEIAGDHYSIIDSADLMTVLRRHLW